MNVRLAECVEPATARAKSVSPISLLSASTLRGSNVHYNKTVVRQHLDLGDFAEQTSGQLGPEFRAKFCERFLHLPTLVPDFAQSEHFADRIEASDDVPIIDIVFEAILCLEATMASMMQSLDLIEFAEIMDEHTPRRWCLVWETQHPQFSRQIAEVAIMGVNELLLGGDTEPMGDGIVDYASGFEVLRTRAGRRRLSPTTSVLIQAAKRRNIPHRRVGSYLRLGQGKFQNQFQASTTGGTSFAAAKLSINKHQTNKRLSELRLPVPRQMRVSSREQAMAAAEKLGFPLVVKPVKGKQGGGITTGLESRKALSDAYETAKLVGDDIVVEQCLTGQDFRLLVVGDRLIAGLTRVPPSIVGDGQRSISELIEELNRDPFRDGLRLVKVSLDEELQEHLGRRGYDFDSVLEHDKELPLRTVANVSKGGVPIDVTDRIHDDFKGFAIKAARGIGLDVAGIDFITTDVSRPYQEAGGGIIEVNARPGLCMHTWPRHGTPRDASGAVLDLVYPKGARCTVAKATIMGDQRTAVIARDLDEFLRTAGRSVGLTIRNHSFINGSRTGSRSRLKRKHVRLLLRDPDIDTLVCTVPPRTAIERGLQLSDTDVAAITEPAEDTDLEEFRQGISVLLRSNPARLVVGARNRVALEALKEVSRSRLVYVSRRGMTKTVRHHLKLGGNAVVLNWQNAERQIVIQEENGSVTKIPGTAASTSPKGDGVSEQAGMTGHRSRRIEIRMFAAALAHGLGLSAEQIAEGISVAPPLLK